MCATRLDHVRQTISPCTLHFNICYCRTWRAIDVIIMWMTSASSPSFIIFIFYCGRWGSICFVNLKTTALIVHTDFISRGIPNAAICGWCHDWYHTQNKSIRLSIPVPKIHRLIKTINRVSSRVCSHYQPAELRAISTGATWWAEQSTLNISVVKHPQRSRMNEWQGCGASKAWSY